MHADTSHLTSLFEHATEGIILTNGEGIGPGWTYFLTPNIGLEALFKYNGIVGFGSRPTSNNLNLEVGFQIYLSSARARAIRNQVESDIRR